VHKSKNKRNNTQVICTTRCDEQNLDVMKLDETVSIGTRITYANDMMVIPVINYGYHH
jgi:hypothetical protein